MPRSAPHDTLEQIDSLHQGYVVEMRRRLCGVGEARRAPFRFREEPVDRAPTRDNTSLTHSIEQALRKVTSMQALIHAHEDTIFDLRRADATHDGDQVDSRQLLEASERRCCAEAERATQAERLIELLERRNGQMEKNFADLSRKVAGLLHIINQT